MLIIEIVNSGKAQNLGDELGKASLTAKQARFVQEYLVDLNATQAAIRAGYAINTAEVQGCQLLRNPKVATAVQMAQSARAKRIEITQDMVLREYAKLAFANMGDFVRPDGHTELSEVSRDQMAAVQEVTTDELVQGRGEDARTILRVKLKLADKKGALDSVARHLGMFTDRTEIAGKLTLEGLVAASLGAAKGD